MRIMPIINNVNHNVNRFNPSCKGTQEAFDARKAQLTKQGYVLLNDGMIKTESGNYLHDDSGKLITGHFLSKNTKDGYELMVADGSLNKLDTIKATLGVWNKYWCSSKEPTSLLEVQLPDSKILRLHPEEIPSYLEKVSGENKALMQDAIKQAQDKKKNVWKLMEEGYKIFLHEINLYQKFIKFVHVNADSQEVVDFFRRLGFQGNDFNPKAISNVMMKKVSKGPIGRFR